MMIKLMVRIVHITIFKVMMLSASFCRYNDGRQPLSQQFATLVGMSGRVRLDECEGPLRDSERLFHTRSFVESLLQEIHGDSHRFEHQLIGWVELAASAATLLLPQLCHEFQTKVGRRWCASRVTATAFVVTTAQAKGALQVGSIAVASRTAAATFRQDEQIIPGCRHQLIAVVYHHEQQTDDLTDSGVCSLSHCVLPIGEKEPSTGERHSVGPQFHIVGQCFWMMAQQLHELK